MDISGIASLIAASAGIVVAAGGYFQFVLRRSVFPCIEFDVDLIPMATELPGPLVADVVLCIKNVGPGVGFINSVQCRVRYNIRDDALTPSSKYAGEPEFTQLLSNCAVASGTVAAQSHQSCIADRELQAQAGDDTQTGDERDADQFTQILTGSGCLRVAPKAFKLFIQPGVTHRYRKPLIFEHDEVQLVHVWAAFEYHLRVGNLAWSLARLLVERPDARDVRYTIRRTFHIQV
jgi:hypothetical protein